jgi:hypothetical protein
VVFIKRVVTPDENKFFMLGGMDDQRPSSPAFRNAKVVVAKVGST